ncbi:MAG TPA: acyl-CoA dehydrogenase family protein [Micromonosporaceae bacterium]|jgi:acyl-CoA dehydrogenase
MDFTMTQAQTTLGALTRQILADRKPAKEFDRPLWMDLAKAGVLCAALASSAGGEGYGLLEQCTILSEIGRGVAPLPYATCIAGAASAIARFGSPALVDGWARPAGRGEAVLTVAFPDGTVHTRASPSGIVLEGSCTAVPAGIYADLILVAVDGTGVALVSPSDEGTSVQPQQIAGGPGAGHMCFDSVRVPTERVLADPAAARWLRERVTVGLCATQLGILERAVELTAEHARTRVQFGRPIGTFQAVAQRLADAYVDLQAVRLTLWQAAWRLARDLPCPTEVGTAKFWAADAGHRVAHTAVHVHGGAGIDVDHIVQRYFLAAKYHELTLGGATAQLLDIGSALITAELDA